MYTNCYELDLSVFDIIDAALSFRIFSQDIRRWNGGPIERIILLLTSA